MNQIYTFLAFISRRLAEPSSNLAMMAMFGAAGLTVSDATYHAILLGLAIVTGLLAIVTKEHAAAVASGAPNVMTTTLVQTLFDFMGQGPAVAALAKQLLSLHTSGKLTPQEVLALLPNINALVTAAVPSDPAPVIVVAAPAAPMSPPPAPAPIIASGPIGGLVGAILLAVVTGLTLSACVSATTAKDVLAEADATYQALASFEIVAGEYCAANPTVAPCPSIPFAKIAVVDQAIYVDLTAANTAAAASDATSQSIALAAIDQQLPQLLALIPTSTDPAINAAIAALKIAVTTFTTDLGAQS